MLLLKRLRSLKAFALAAGSLNLFALAFALLLVWAAERVIVQRQLAQFQRQMDIIATHLAEGGQRKLVMGATIAAGIVDPLARETARGSLPPGNPQALNLLKRLDRAFGLSDAFIMNPKGDIVAYQIDEGPSITGRNLAHRPYFLAAMAGTPNMYAALGINTGERGFYIATPIIDPDAERKSAVTKPDATAAAHPSVFGVLVSKLGFAEVDELLNTQTFPVAVVSPEGVIFATNRPQWMYQVICNSCDLAAIRVHPRSATAFERAAPVRLTYGQNDWNNVESTGSTTVIAPIDWKDANGPWQLVGFADTSGVFGAAERVLVGFAGYLIIILFGAWRHAHQEVLARTRDLEAANRQLAALSITDALTGIANRRRFDAALTEEWLRAKRSREPLTLMMIDIDFFKQYNDHYGHGQGDECLRAVARIVDAHAKRIGDLAARYGGEEFCLLLANTDVIGAQSSAESLRRAVETLAIPHARSPVGTITLSIGVAVMSAEAGTVADPLLASADKALYQAKSGGRNRVVLSS